MNHKFALRVGTLVLILIIVITLWGSRDVTVQAGDADQDIPWVDPVLLAKSKTSEPLDYLIFFDEQADLSEAYGMSWETRGWYVYETLTALAEASQAEVRAYLDAQGVPYEAFWVQNVIAVQSSTSTTLTGLLNFHEIKSLQSIPQIYLEEQLVSSSDDVSVLNITEASSNLVQINADDVWSLGIKGEGMILGSIDTGVRYTHEALVGAYRGNLGEGNLSHHYHWWDAVNDQDAPYDDHGHGSHVTGIMVGARGVGEEIGVAPEADWIACKAISQSGRAWGNDLIECGQFMAAPTNLSGENPNPNLRPHAVNNSWGDCGRTYNPWYEGVIDAWLAAGIYPVFANGNSGNCGYPSPPGLNTVGNPARSHHVTAVGSTGRDDGQYAPHSNWGPTDSEDTLNPNGYPLIKPQVVAPGVGIPSAVASGDGAYEAWSGTSMSAPHVAGLVALMWRSGDCLAGDYVKTETLIQETAVPIPYETGNGDEGPGNVPNHATGWGEIDALAAVDKAITYCSGGFLDGVVRNSEDQQPISSAVIDAVTQGDAVSITTTVTDEHGYYQAFVNSQVVYELRASAYGYHPEVVVDVAVPGPGEKTTTDFSLTPKTNQVYLSGVVRDGGGQGYPLYAQVVLETDGQRQVTFTNPFDGSYEMTVYDDLEYAVTVIPMISGYFAVHEPTVSFTMPSAERDYVLDITENCDAPGYGLTNRLSESFDRGSLPAGWEVWDHAGGGVTWRFDNHSIRGNMTGGSAGFAIVDSDYAGPIDVDTSLVSPPVNLAGESVVVLTFDQDFFFYDGNAQEIADVDVSVAGGDWQNVLRQTTSVRGANQTSMDISEIAANQADVRVRFRYYNAHADWWWQVDNVQLGGQACVPLSGGVLAGLVSNRYSGEPLVGVIVYSDAARVETKGTPQDINLGDGFYWLFQPTHEDPQTITVTADKNLYLEASADVQIQQNMVNRHDITLVSFINHLGFVFNNLLSLIWEFLLSLSTLIRGGR
jgi:subtilisin family serine protease